MNKILTNRAKNLIQLLTENNVRTTTYLNLYQDEIFFDTDLINWNCKYLSISSIHKEYLETLIEETGAKIIRDNNLQAIIFLGEDLTSKDTTLTIDEIKEIFS
ncbi:hypothetical protein ALC152_05190 [Arcobacter sp. 15-2]|uniref:hypothetical protein n=1 Tax=Arcobacter sp. 15-2 TaxID=3374109 RepID=UPI00399C73B4